MSLIRRYLLHEQADDVDSACNIRRCNGLSIMLKLMEPQIGPDLSVEFPLQIPVLVALCVTLARLAYTDVSNGLLICNGNGVSYLGLMLTQHSRSGDEQIQELHGHALSTMRILFSLEKNRKVFRRVFPPHIFDAFIDKGQYIGNDARLFFPVAALIQELPPEKELGMRQQLIDMLNRPLLEVQHSIRGYVLEEEIGKGAFGSVFRARSLRGRDDEFAIKQFKIDCIPRGTGNHDTLEEVSSEVRILSLLKHPNIVQHQESFIEGDSVYIVTELVRGTTLLDHINAASEKRESIPENKVWDIFFEICMALLYIHKKKNIIHRDLTPSNIMLDFNGCVKIIDFGLARRVAPNDGSIVASVVGTLQYSCPELIQHQPYTDKADIWSLGVILYQMCCLTNPFADANPLLSAKKIVEATYDQSKLIDHSLDLRNMISKLLQPKAENRPDIVNVLASFPPQRMVCMKLEDLYTDNHNYKRRESEHYKKIEELHFKLAQKDQELRRACAAPSRIQIAPGTPEAFIGSLSFPLTPAAPLERIKARHCISVFLFYALKNCTMNHFFKSGSIFAYNVFSDAECQRS
jgi:serine/threonine protein kinase